MKIAILASGQGTNAKNIVEKLKDKHEFIIITNNPKSGVVQISKELTVECFIHSDDLEQILINNDIDFIVLAGYLKLIPKSITDKYQNKIVNIHPSLLPLFGGKGMFGDNVHRAVLESKQLQSGITIHYVNSKYDSGEIIKQVKINLDEVETLESLKNKIHILEMEWFPRIIESLV